jgi:hypothetical protein
MFVKQKKTQKKMRIVIKRHNQDKNQTTGVCMVFGEDKILFSSMSLERGWRNNEKRVSCIPKGEYKCVLEWSNRFKSDLWEIKGVENRSECKFHSANYWYQLNGCIALGQKLKDINKDGYRDVTNSRNTMKQFHSALKGHTEATLIVE